MPIREELREIIARFDIPGACVEASAIRTGHINRTYALTFEEAGGVRRRYVLQRINTYVFKKPDEVMDNILRVTEHLRRAWIARGVDPENRVLRVVPARDGQPLAEDREGGSWRVYAFIEHSVSRNHVESPEQFTEIGRAFGQFQTMLSDFPVAALHDTIPFFHDTRRRQRNFEASVAADALGRAASVGPEIAFARARAEAMGRIVDMIAEGTLPLRVTHNDTKINNVMLDEATGKAMCVVDLDTVMAGSALYDYGDAIRFGASTADEDETDLDRVRMDLGLFSAFTEGFVEQTAAGLTLAELENLPLGARVMTYENGLRFLTDYLDGDVYFHIDHPGHNLDRARNQFRLLEDMEEKRGAMDATVRALIEKYR